MKKSRSKDYEYHRRWRLANPEADLAKARRWREKYPEKAREAHRLWRKRNPEKAKEHQRRQNEKRKRKRKGFATTPFFVLVKNLISITLYWNGHQWTDVMDYALQYEQERQAVADMVEVVCKEPRANIFMRAVNS